MDSNKLSHLLHTLYGSVTSGDWQPFLHALSQNTKSSKAMIFLKNNLQSKPPFLNIVANFDYPESALVNYLMNIEQDPYYQESKMFPAGDICEASKLVDIQAFQQTEFYKMTFCPMRTHHATGAIILRDENYDSALVLNRSVDEAPFGQKETELLALLTPHVQQAMRLFALFQDISQQNDMLKVVLNQSDKALLVLDADAGIQLANQQADTILTTLPYWQCMSNRFRLTLPAEQLRFSTLLKQCLQDEVLNQDRLYLQLSSDEPGMQVSLTLAPLRWLQLDNGSDNLCLLTITYQHLINWSAVKDEYRLTARELELVQALHNNQKLTELTEQMGISYHTLRKHLQTVFAKCRVNSQSELMLLLGRFRY